MESNIRMDGDVVTMSISGDLVASSAEEFKLQVGQLLDKNFIFILLEISKVNFMDSSGLGACMAVHKMLSGKNGKMVLAKPSEAVGKILRLTRADQKLKIAQRPQDGIMLLHDAIIAGRNK